MDGKLKILEPISNNVAAIRNSLIGTGGIKPNDATAGLFSELEGPERERLNGLISDGMSLGNLKLLTGFSTLEKEERIYANENNSFNHKITEEEYLKEIKRIKALDLDGLSDEDIKNYSKTKDFRTFIGSDEGAEMKSLLDESFDDDSEIKDFFEKNGKPLLSLFQTYKSNDGRIDDDEKETLFKHLKGYIEKDEASKEKASKETALLDAVNTLNNNLVNLANIFGQPVNISYENIG